MTMFSSDRILRLCPLADQKIVEASAAALDRLAAQYDLVTFLRRVHFMAQCAHESASFTKMVENLNYSAQRIAQVWPRLKDRAHELERKPRELANAAYASRFGNRDEASGDGWRYRGRGPFMLTFRDNYRECGVSIGKDLIGSPDLVADPVVGMEVALHYWITRGCQEAADKDNVELVTRLINGGSEGLDARRRLTERAKTIFLDDEPLIS